MPSLTTSNAGDGPQPPCALQVATAWGHLRRCRSSTMAPHRPRRGTSYLAPRRSQRDHADFHHGLPNLCELFDQAKPAEVDPAGDFFTFEKGATKKDGSDGWADVWKRGDFAWGTRAATKLERIASPRGSVRPVSFEPKGRFSDEPGLHGSVR